MNPQDGRFEIGRDRLEGLLGQPLADGIYTVRLQAVDDAGNASPLTDVALVLDTQIATPSIAGIDEDTGASDSDGVTSDSTPTLLGTAEPGSTVTLSETTLGQIGTSLADQQGNWSIGVSSTAFADGPLSFTVSSQDVAGNTSALSSSFSIEVDTVAPVQPQFDLAPASDTAPVGDQETTFPVVTLVGATDPHVQVELVEAGLFATSNASGAFTFGGVSLALGANTLTARATDLAGNEQTFVQTITRVNDGDESSLQLSEGDDFLTEAALLLDLSQEPGARTISFDLTAAFDTSDTSTIVEDTLLVYLVDPANPSHTLLDRGQPGTALLALSGDAAEYPPGLVNFDGTTVEIDVTSLGATSQALLLAQLVNSDADTGTTVSLDSIANTVNPDDVENPVFRRKQVVDAPAGPLDLATLAATSNVELSLQNIRVDSQTGRYTAELLLRNTGADFGRQAAVLFPGLPAGVTLANASGTSAAGEPYVNMFGAILPGGLTTGDKSFPVLLEFDNPGLLRFGLTPTVLASGPNSPPSLEPVGPISLMPGQYFETRLVATEPDGDAVGFSIQSDGALPTGMLKADGTLIFTPSPDDVGSYSFAIVATDGPTQTKVPVSVTVLADPVTTTRISGTILNTDSQPLAAVPIELGTDQTFTAADGTFTLTVTSPLDPADCALRAWRGPHRSGRLSVHCREAAAALGPRWL